MLTLLHAALFVLIRVLPLCRLLTVLMLFLWLLLLLLLLLLFLRWLITVLLLSVLLLLLLRVIWLRGMVCTTSCSCIRLGLPLQECVDSSACVW